MIDIFEKPWYITIVTIRPYGQEGFFLSPCVPICHCTWKVLWTVSSVRAQLMGVRLGWFTYTGVSLIGFNNLTNEIFHLCPACFIRLMWMIYEMGVKWLYSDVSKGAASTISSKKRVKFFCISYLAFSPRVLFGAAIQYYSPGNNLGKYLFHFIRDPIFIWLIISL